MTEHTLTRPGAPNLAYAIHRPPSGTTTTGAVVLTHGYAEHSARYHEVVDALVLRGLVVATYDLRGHGRSAGHRGHVDRFDDYLDDLRALLDALRLDAGFRSAGAPLLLGHSLGGLISFHAALAMPDAFAGVVLSSPFFGLALAVPAAKRFAARALSRLVPTFGLPSGLRGADVTQNAARARAYDEDPMRVPNATARWFTEAMRAQEEAFARAPSMRLPIVVFAGGADRVASTPATEALFARIGAGSKRLQVLPGQFHEIFNEPERAQWIALAADAAADLARRV